MDLFSNLILAFFALLPLISVSAVLLLAAFLTETLCQSCNDPFHNVLQWFFIMIPFTALQAPPVIFFFNFSAEAHVLLKRKDTKLL